MNLDLGDAEYDAGPDVDDIQVVVKTCTMIRMRGIWCQQKGFVMINCYIRSTNSPCFDIGQWSAEVN